MEETITYAGIIPELDNGKDLAVYQIIAVCGPGEKLTRKMKSHMELFGSAFYKIADRFFEENIIEGIFGWPRKSFRPAPELEPRIIKTSYPVDYSEVVRRLQEKYSAHGQKLVTGEEAVQELRGLVELLKKDKNIFREN